MGLKGPSIARILSTATFKKCGQTWSNKSRSIKLSPSIHSSFPAKIWRVCWAGSKCSVPADMCSSQFARGSFSLLRLERNLSGSGQILQSDAMLLVQCAQRFAVMIIKISDPWWIKKAQNPPICWDLWWFIQRRKHGKKTSGFRGSNLPGIPYHPAPRRIPAHMRIQMQLGHLWSSYKSEQIGFPKNSPSKSTNQSTNQQILTMLGMIPMMCQRCSISSAATSPCEYHIAPGHWIHVGRREDQQIVYSYS